VTVRCIVTERPMASRHEPVTNPVMILEVTPAVSGPRANLPNEYSNVRRNPTQPRHARQRAPARLRGVATPGDASGLGPRPPPRHR
jgi:hypothetical protein